MDAIGVPELRWVKGYNGRKARYIDKNTVVYNCGNNINFMKEGGESTVFTSPGEGVTALDVHPINKLFAFAELCINPKIFVFSYPNMQEVSVLKEGAKLEYSNLAFSCSDYLVTISGIPDFKLNLWNYYKGEMLMAVDIVQTTVTGLSVNPGNWRNICFTTSDSNLFICNIEQSDTKFNSVTKMVKLFVEKSPHESETSAVHQDNAAAGIEITPSVVAGLFEPDASSFDDYKAMCIKCIPSSHCWTPAGDVLVGCQLGQLLRIDGETWRVKPIVVPELNRDRQSDMAVNRGVSLLSKQMSIREEDSMGSSDDLQELGRGSVDCIALHKNGLYVAGKEGVLRCLNITNDKVKVLDRYPIGEQVTSLDFSTNWSHINLGTSSGTMYTYDINAPGSTSVFMREHSSNFVSVQSLAPGLEYAVTIREKGELQVWHLSNGIQAGVMNLNIEATSMACSPVAPIALIGTTTGYAYVIDLTDPSKGRIIHRARPYNKPVTRAVYTSQGAYVLLGSDDGQVIIMSGRADRHFKMLCYTSVDGAIETITTYTPAGSNDVNVAVSSNPTGDVTHGAVKCTVFQLKESIMSSVESYYSSLKGDIQDDVINKIVFNYASPSYGACLVSQDTLYSLAQDNKMLQRINVPKEKPKKPNSKDSFLFPETESSSHQLPGGKILLSPHKKWLASVGADGKLHVRVIGSWEQFVEAHPHDYRHGGVKSVCWSAGCQHLLTTGRNDGILTCYVMKYKQTGEAKGKSAVAAAKQMQSQLSDVIMRERDALRAQPEWKPENQDVTTAQAEAAKKGADVSAVRHSAPQADMPWLQYRQILAHQEEDKQYSDIKKELRFEIEKVRKMLQALIDKNKSVPDIEKLQHHDFDLDVDEQQRLQAVGDAEVQKIRESIEFENLAKQYLTYLIKQECWDAMEVKGRSIEGFDIALEVQNYPMQKRSKQELEELSKAVAIRKIEIAEAKARAEMVEISLPKPSQNKLSSEDDGDEEDNSSGESSSVTGSMGALYGGGNDLFYNQFELYDREQKVVQIVLLKDAIHKIKVAFNKEFDDIMTKKEQELAKIAEKKKRILKIYQDLNINENVKILTFSTKERPDLLLSVDDAEVTVEKYLTPEQKKLKEELEKVEEERKKKEKGDNARERALDQMMGGVLEIKKEDELKKDIPIPSFVQVKEQQNWTEDEQKIHKDYEKKCKELNEEREKYRKQLDTELKKLEQLIAEAEQAFNDQLKLLFTKRLKVEMVICQEELKILRLQWGIMYEEALNTKVKQLASLIEHKKDLKVLAAEAYIIARKNVDSFKEGYDILVAEDKVMDKGFKREFSDLPALQYELLYKLFRKRPRGNKALHTRGETPILDANSGNPFAERPSTSRQNLLQKHALEAALVDLDKPLNMPEGVDEHVWSRLCKYRKAKIESEILLKQKALVMAELMSFQTKRQEEDYKLAEEIDDLGNVLNKLRESIQRYSINLQVQLLLKQGQVEVDSGSFIHNYTESVLIHRSVVEDLNGKIKTLGESKIASMVESKDFRKGIIQLEWEHKKNLMKIEDLKEKMKVISMMKVTREIQAYLDEADHDAKIAQEISILEQTLLMQKKHHEENVEVKKKSLKELQHIVIDKQIENKSLLAEIEDLNVSVNERQHIHEARADKNVESAREKRYQEIVQRRKLVDLAKAQANEVAILRAEVERLRMRTFPALVQVER